MFAKATGRYHCTATTMETTTTTTTTASVAVDLDRRADSVVDIVDHPQRHDVILGRGKRYQYHFGNLYFDGTHNARACVNRKRIHNILLVPFVVVWERIATKSPT
jgi:septum formation inhibitor-activating ATPase MinD